MPKQKDGENARFMKVSSIILCDEVIRHGSIHGAARASGVPVSTISDAVGRLEAALSVTLFGQSTNNLILTAEGARIGPYLRKAATEIHGIYGKSNASSVADLHQRSVSLIALFRFADILESGSIRKSARRLQIGQPQLTRMIAKLEEHLGVKLILRTRGGSRASPEGNRILPHVNRLRDIWAFLDSTSALRFRRHLRHWSIGGIPPATYDSPSAIILARIAANWAERYDTPLLMQPALADSLLEGLEQSRYDAVIVDLAVTNSRLCSQEVQRSYLSFFMRRDDAGDDDSLTCINKAIQTKRLVLPSSAAGLRQTAEGFLEHLLGPAWLSQVQLTEIDSIPVAVQLIVNHGYCSILPSTLKMSVPELAKIALPDDFFVPLHLAWRNDDKGAHMARRIFDVL